MIYYSCVEGINLRWGNPFNFQNWNMSNALALIVCLDGVVENHYFYSGQNIILCTDGPSGTNYL